MGSKGGQPKHTTQTTTSEPPSWQVPFIKKGLKDADQWRNWIADQPAYPDTSTVAGFTPNQLVGQNMMTGAAGAMMPQVGQYQSAGLNMLSPYSDPMMGMYASQLPGAMGYLGSEMAGAGGAPMTTDALNQMMSATPDMSVWGPLMNQVSDNAITSFQEEVMPTLRTNAMMTGQFGGGSRPALEGGIAADKLYENIIQGQNQLAQAAASEALQQRTAGTALAEQQRSAMAQEGLGAASMLTGGANDVFNRLATNQLGALGMGGQVMGYGTLPASLFSQVGAEQQAMNQAQLDDAVQRFMAERNSPLQNLGSYQQLVTGSYGGSTASQVPYFPKSPIMSGLGGAALGAGIGSMFAPAGATGLAAVGGWPFLLGGAALGLFS